MVRSFDAIADDLNCSVLQIKKIVRKHNLEFLSIGQKKSMNEEQYNKFIETITEKYKSI